MTQPPATNDTGTTTGQPLTVEAISNVTEGYTWLQSSCLCYAPVHIKLDAKVTGGTPPYNYFWSTGEGGGLGGGRSPPDSSFEFITQRSIPGTYTFRIGVVDIDNPGTNEVHETQASDTVQIIIHERPPPEGGEVLLPPETGQEGQPQGGGLLPRTVPPSNDTGQVISPPPPEGEEGGTPPSTTTEEGGEEPSPPPPPPSDDTGEDGEGGESPTDEEEPTTPPDGGG